jgi:hypothetical protein
MFRAACEPGSRSRSTASGVGGLRVEQLLLKRPLNLAPTRRGEAPGDERERNPKLQNVHRGQRFGGPVTVPPWMNRRRYVELDPSGIHTPPAL